MNQEVKPHLKLPHFILKLTTLPEETKMAIPKKADKFIQGAAANKASKNTQKEKPQSKYLLHIPADLRQEIRLESIKNGFPNMSDYICSILKKRKQIKKI